MTCRSCRHWRPHIDAEGDGRNLDIGRCGGMEHGDPRATISHRGTLTTRAEFTCALHEEDAE